MKFDDQIDQLLNSDNKTTEMLEKLIGKILTIKVLSQRYKFVKNTNGIPLYRESLVTYPEENLVVSHNFVLLYPKYIPTFLYYNMIWKKKGIGHLLNEHNVKTNRRITRNGFIDRNKLTNLFSEPVQISFQSKTVYIPFKAYNIYFEDYKEPGFMIIEYFNSDIFSRNQNSA